MDDRGLMEHDSAYHRLFSNPQMLADLFRHFITEDWVEQLDFSTLNNVNAKFHTSGLKLRQGDLIFSIQTHQGQNAYILILLEFQSTPEHWMAVRLNAYAALLYESLIKEQQLTAKDRLPPVFPLVLYNGERRWKAPQSLDKLIDLPRKHALWRYQPNLRYYLIDESQYLDAGVNSLSGQIFDLENCTDQEQLHRYVLRLIETTQGESYQRLRQDILAWLRWVLAPAKQLELDLGHVQELSEVKRVLQKRIEQWQKQWLQQGIEQGIEQGVLRGEAKLLAQLLEKRFGSLPDWAEQRLSEADSQQIEHWSHRLLEVDSLEAVFK